MIMREIAEKWTRNMDNIFYSGCYHDNAEMLNIAGDAWWCSKIVLILIIYIFSLFSLTKSPCLAELRRIDFKNFIHCIVLLEIDA